MTRPLPRRVLWAALADQDRYNLVEARAGVVTCDHLDANKKPVPGPCVGRIRPGDLYLSVKGDHRSRITLRCAVAAGIVIDGRLTPPLTETLLCAATGILFWLPLDDPPHAVWILADSGQMNSNPVAQAAAMWLARHDLIEIPETTSKFEPITITLHGRYEVAAIRAQAVRKMRG